jgi:hypothetical protein
MISCGVRELGPTEVAAKPHLRLVPRGIETAKQAQHSGAGKRSPHKRFVYDKERILMMI